jgi:hypothetical protein
MSTDKTNTTGTTGKTAKNYKTRTRRTPVWLSATVAILFGLFYAYVAWSGVGNLVGVSTMAQGLDTTLSGFGWGVLLVGVLAPVVVFAVAFWLGRRREVGPQALILLAGLCLVSALSLDVFVFGYAFGSLIV